MPVSVVSTTSRIPTRQGFISFIKEISRFTYILYDGTVPTYAVGCLQYSVAQACGSGKFSRDPPGTLAIYKVV